MGIIITGAVINGIFIIAGIISPVIGYIIEIVLLQVIAIQAKKRIVDPVDISVREVRK